ncbi:hypothetical protein GH5_02461 [Leishmania sp. Ghana 2012 LV757]|uniref:hypothetical protein n=1 Tax=Leishmania sp. Ghana 2012 LV757 TaxID=2803181 RepID=UPI001B5EFDA5|nr:hypothetical protein GH5_02461 [Leishmania sp. Ghana 2012 LV757]
MFNDSSEKYSLIEESMNRLQSENRGGYAANEYTTVEDFAQSTTTATSAAAPAPGDSRGGASYAEYMAVKTQLEEARAQHEQRMREITQNSLGCDINSLPSLEELRRERVRLSEQVRHHKDEQDSLALDIEGLEGAGDVYQLAARVQRLEHFVNRAMQYTEEALPLEISKAVEEDRYQSNLELGAYIQELQRRRANTLKKVADAQEIMSRRSQLQNAAENAAANPEYEDPMEAKAARHTQENKDECVMLQQKIRKFRSMITKLRSDIAKESKDSKKMEERMCSCIRNMELANARDARLCKELNNRNSAGTTNSQLLMDQLNVEHYGFDSAPKTKQLLEDIKDRQAMGEWTLGDQQQDMRDASFASFGSPQSRTNSITASQRAVKLPMVALKRTESQRARDNASREDREEFQQSLRRSSSAGNYQFSRGASLSKPPLVAMKPTASQQSRDSALREEREEAMAFRSGQRSSSLGSDARTPTSMAKLAA